MMHTESGRSYYFLQLFLTLQMQGVGVGERVINLPAEDVEQSPLAC